LHELTVSLDDTDDLLRLGLHRLPIGKFPDAPAPAGSENKILLPSPLSATVTAGGASRCKTVRYRRAL
jgi:hypothetical protein